MKYKYGEFSPNQLLKSLEKLRKEIFFLLLIADPKTKEEYLNINVEDAFESIMLKLEGMNEVLLNPPKIVIVISLMERARLEILSEEFNFLRYRKLILDAGNEVIKLSSEGGDYNAES